MYRSLLSEPRITSNTPPRETQHLTLQSLKPPFPTPVNPQPQPDHRSHPLKPPPATPVHPQPQPDHRSRPLKPPSVTPVHPQPQPDHRSHPLKPPSVTPVHPQPQPDHRSHHLKPPSVTPVHPQPQPDHRSHPLKPPSVTPVHPQPQPDLGSHPLKPPPATPVHPQPQPDLGPPEISPIRCNRFLLCSTKYNNIGNQTQVPLDRRVLELHKKFKVHNNNSPGLGKTSIITEPPLASPHSTVQSNSAGLKSEWRKNLHNPLQGFSSPPPTRALPVESSNAGEFSPINPSLCPGVGAVHQRVVQRILMKDSLDPPSFHFHHVIPLNAQQTFFPLNPSGKTRYGRLQFDWMRGRDEGQLWLEPSRQRSALYDLSRST